MIFSNSKPDLTWFDMFINVRFDLTNDHKNTIEWKTEQHLDGSWNFWSTFIVVICDHRYSYKVGFHVKLPMSRDEAHVNQVYHDAFNIITERKSLRSPWVSSRVSYKVLSR